MKRSAMWDEWKGKPVKDLQTHPYFSDLPRKIIKNDSGIETWIYRDDSRFRLPTDAYCQSLGGAVLAFLLTFVITHSVSRMV